MIELFANSGDPDQTPRSAASDLGLHCLQIIILGVSRLQWVKPGHNIFNNFTCAPSQDSDQPAHPRSLIRVFTGRMKMV